MDEKRGVLSEPASISPLSGQKRVGDGLEERDELGSKRAKVRDLDSDTKISSGQMSEVVVAPAAEGLGRVVVREKDVSAKDDNRLVANSGKQALDDSKSESQRGGQVDAVSKNSSLLKPREVSESVVVVSPRDPSVSNQMCGAEGSLEKSDSMRRWMEMKRNGFLSGPLGGVSAPSSAAPTTPVEVPAQKQQKNKRRGDSVKKRNEAPRKEQQQVDRFSNVTAPSGLLTELNPGIINHVRSKKQVCSIIEALIRNATVGERNTDLNVRGIYIIPILIH